MMQAGWYKNNRLLLDFMIMTPVLSREPPSPSPGTSEALRMVKINVQSFLQAVHEKLRFSYDYWLLHLESKTLDFRSKAADVTLGFLVSASLLFLWKDQVISGKAQEGLLMTK